MGRQNKAMTPENARERGYVPAGMRPKASTNGNTKEKHCYGVFVVDDGEERIIAEGLTRSGAECGVHCWNQCLARSGEAEPQAFCRDLGTVAHYRQMNNLPVAQRKK